MGTQPKKNRKRRGKIRFSQKGQIKKKDSVRNDAIPRMQAQSPRTTGAVFKVEIKKK